MRDFAPLFDNFDTIQVVLGALLQLQRCDKLRQQQHSKLIISAQSVFFFTVLLLIGVMAMFAGAGS